MMDLEKLANFLVIAKKATYANEFATKLPDPERPLHDELEYSDGEFYYMDSYVGFFQAPGMEEVRLNNKNGKAIWTMAYSGGMLRDYQESKDFAKETFTFLKSALGSVEESSPFRGPKKLEAKHGLWIYENSFEGDIKRFKGHEKIMIRTDECYQEVFSQDYIGGIVIGK